MLINLRFLVTSELKSCSAFNVCKHYSAFSKTIYERDEPISSLLDRFTRRSTRKIWCPDSCSKCNTQSRRASRLAYYEFGAPSEVVKYETFENPCIEDFETNAVIVRMLAAPINPAHINVIQGTYPIKPKSFPAVGGTEGIGQVHQVGSHVKRLKIGDLVFPSLSDGFWTTHVKGEESDFDKVTLKSQLAFEASVSSSDERTKIIAGLSVMRINPGTAFRMIKDFVSDLKAGDIIIQNGANSAVGQSVIQIAKHMELRTVNVVRDREDIAQLKHYLASIGADYVWTENELRTAKEFRDNILPKARLALNCVGGSSSTEIAKCLDTKGVHVTYGGMSLKPVVASTSSLIFKDITYKGFWFSNWVEKHKGTSELRDMHHQLESMYLNKKICAPRHSMVSIHDENGWKKALSLSSKDKSGDKVILDMIN